VIHEKLLDLCAGNEAAVAFIEGFWSLMEVWDDLIDRDKPVGNEAIDRTMMWALFGLQDNPFYRMYPVALRTSMQHAIASWQTANRFERTGDPMLVEQAYFMRCSPYDVFALVAWLAGGPDKHMEAIAYFRSQARDDSLAAYMLEHIGESHGMAQFPQAPESP